MPNLLQPNRAVPPVVDVINPVRAAVVAGKILRVVEAYPCSIFLLIYCMIWHKIEEAVGTHGFRHELIIPIAVDVEGDAIHVLLLKSLRSTKRLPLEVILDLVAR